VISWRLFVIVWLIYVIATYFFVIGLSMIIGFGFFLNPPAFLSAIARVLTFPASLVDNAFSFITGKELYHFVSVSLAGMLVSSVTCLVLFGAKLLIKKLTMLEI